MSPLPAGSLLGRDRILRPLGAGAMGEVYHGVDDGGREAAIKLLAMKFAENHDYEELAEMFGATPGALRMRVSRIREKLAARAGRQA
jgi:serine/threonine protein kinase